jgi:hypothetical protein
VSAWHAAMEWLDGLNGWQLVGALGAAWFLIALAFGKVADKAIDFVDDEEEPFEWCDACRSYHAADNPTCKEDE